MTLVRSTAGCSAVPVAEDPVVVPDSTLMDEAAGLLKYRPLELQQDADTRKQRQHVRRSNVIRQALAKLDDPPFDPKSVERYKKDVDSRCKPWYEYLSVRIFLPLFFTALAGVVVYGVPWVALDVVQTVQPTWLTESVEKCALAALATGILALLLRLRVKEQFFQIVLCLYTTKTDWIATRLDQYKKPIPEFVIQTAVDLRKKFGDDVTFFVEELEVKRQDIVMVFSDPFLTVRLPDGTLYYLEVWNEPTFKGNRIA